MNPGWKILRDRSYLELKGPDAVRFLNGQVSNDLDRDLSGIVVPACLCSLKGKVEGLIWITKGMSDNALLIDAEAAQADDIFNRLDRYLIADDCELAMLHDVEITHLVSDSAPGGGRQSWRFGFPGWDLYNSGEVSGLDELGDDEILRSRILHGVPDSGNEISGQEFPSELGLDSWAVDFHKGCYLGQEIVSRLQSVGKARHRTALYRTTESYERGHRFEDTAGKEFARVLRTSVPDGKGRFLSLVFEKRIVEEPGFQEIAITTPPRI